MNIKKHYFKYGYIILIALGVLAGCGVVPSAAKIDINAKCALIMEVKSGNVLFAKNANKRFPPASTTKIMTAIVASENMTLDTKIEVSKEAAEVEPVVAGITPGAQYALDDLLAAALIRSGNDAAKVIAEGVGSTENKFSGLMNRKAKKIGMRNTYFANASGLPTNAKDTQFVTARDLALMMRYALKNETVMETLSKKTCDITGSDGKKIHLTSINKTLFDEDNALWGKTGYTKEAKRTFVGVDASSRPRIIIAVLQSNDLWRDLSKLKSAGLELYEEKQKSIFTKIRDFLYR